MIFGKPVRNHAGMMVYGDYTSLRYLHDTIHAVDSASPLIDKKEGEVFLGLAYDVRKAYEQEREKIKPDANYPEAAPFYGFKTLWPVILLQSRILRESLAYLTATPLQQAMTHALEHAIETAIRQDFEGQADYVIKEWQAIDPRSQEPVRRMNSRGAVFSTWSKAERKNGIISLLASFRPDYDELYEYRAKVLKWPDLIHPNGFRGAGTEDDWPDPHW